MREIQFTYPIPVVNSVAATQTTTASNTAIVLNGSLSNIANIANLYGGYVAQATPGPGIQRTVTITSTGNISTSTFTITGFDLRATGLLSTTVTGPNNATATSGTEFARVLSITPGTLASSNFTVGFGATGSTQWVTPNRFANPFNMSLTVVTVTSAPVTLQDTPDDVQTNPSPTIFNHATLAGVTVNQESNYAFPVRYTRAVFLATAAATGSAVVSFLQTG